jgi:hypothetical protein
MTLRARLWRAQNWKNTFRELGAAFVLFSLSNQLEQERLAGATVKERTTLKRHFQHWQ